MESSDKIHLLPLLDACRPGSADLDDPQLAAAAARVATDTGVRQLHRRIERLDDRIAEAFDDVPVPAGLADRVLARLRATASQASPGVVDEADSETPAPQANEPAGGFAGGFAGHRSVGRRRLLWSAVGLAGTIAAAVLIAVSLWPQPLDPLTSDEVLEAAIARFVEDPLDPHGGRPLDTAPSALPPSDGVIVPSHAAWQPLEPGLAGVPTVAYDLSSPRHGRRATLYVMRRPLASAPIAPPPTAERDTRGVCAAAWTVGELSYVLVVEGSQRDYRQMLRASGGPLT